MRPDEPTDPDPLGSARERRDSPVLIAYDGSDFAKAAVAEAGRQLRPGREALILTVTEPLEKIPFIGAAGVPSTTTRWRRLIEAAARRGGEDRGGGLRPRPRAGLDPEPLVARRPDLEPHRRHADEHDADLIVIGSRGLSGIKYAVLGCVAAAVAQHSKRTVLIAHKR